MSTPADFSLQLRDMTTADIEAVLEIEETVHAHPWTRGNFTDALESAYLCKIIEQNQGIEGYAILMPALDEVHLLDLSIAFAAQRQGRGAALLQALLALARTQQFTRMLLEVRRSNLAASALYRKLGFVEIGVRRGYYPAAAAREDAIVMECKLS